MLTIVQVAYPFAPVGPDAVGGAEQVLAQLDQGAVRAGHRSIVVAAEGSRVAGRLVALPTLRERVTGEQWVRMHAAMRERLAELARDVRPDVIHLHGVDAHAYLPPAGGPAVITLHLPPEYYPTAMWTPPRPDTWLLCVSDAQRRRCPPSAALIGTIANGVDVEAYALPRRPAAWALAMGRICAEKGFARALDAAHLADLPLLIAGRVFPHPEHERYFAREIAPRLDRRCRFVGPVGLARKRRLLARARCVVVASEVEETSSLVVMEALAAGCPVVATPRGALAQLVTPGVTGFLARDVAGLAHAILAAPSIGEAACRADAYRRFDAHLMVRRHLQLYERLALRSALRDAG